MALKYDLPEYIVMTRMSSKARVLVEGKDDKSHVRSLINLLQPALKFKIDMAGDIKGSCNDTRTNNRAKIEKIHAHCKSQSSHKKLFFLCDREFRNFEFGASVLDTTTEHEVDGNMSWTLGHSFENYFLSGAMLAEGFKFLTASGFKNKASLIFNDIFDTAIRFVAAATLAAKNLHCAGYPCKVFNLENFQIKNGELITITKEPAQDQFQQDFISYFQECLAVSHASELTVCTRFCRGHTAVVLMQRIFAACILEAGIEHDLEQAEYEARLFTNVSETSISSALSESWIKRVSTGEAMYPAPLVQLINAVA